MPVKGSGTVTYTQASNRQDKVSVPGVFAVTVQA